MTSPNADNISIGFEKSDARIKTIYIMLDELHDTQPSIEDRERCFMKSFSSMRITTKRIFRDLQINAENEKVEEHEMLIPDKEEDEEEDDEKEIKEDPFYSNLSEEEKTYYQDRLLNHHGNYPHVEANWSLQESLFEEPSLYMEPQVLNEIIVPLFDLKEKALDYFFKNAFTEYFRFYLNNFDELRNLHFNLLFISKNSSKENSLFSLQTYSNSNLICGPEKCITSKISFQECKFIQRIEEIKEKINEIFTISSFYGPFCCEQNLYEDDISLPPLEDIYGDNDDFLMNIRFEEIE